jgi:RHS repeat-associated protein
MYDGAAQYVPSAHKFTGKERDSESNLDYFGSRHYTSTVGRFMQPDELFADQDTGDPQSWNMYAYTVNNPVPRQNSKRPV